MSHEDRDARVTKLEASLAELLPRADLFNRDAVMFRAGEAAARRPSWFWPGATCLLTVIAVALGVMAFRQADPISIDRIVYVSLPSPASDGRLIERRSTAIESTAGAPSAPAYLAARNHVLRWGVEELPEACGSQSAAQPVSVESLLGLPPGTNEPALKRLIQSLKPGA